MTVTFFSPQKIFTVALPEQVRGQYWISDQDKDDHLRCVASAEGFQGQWILRGSKDLRLLKDGAEVESLVLQPEI